VARKGRQEKENGARLVVAADAVARLAEAAAWLGAFPPAAEVVVLAATRTAADELVRAVVVERGARFGVERLTLGRLAARLATPALAAAGRVPASPLALDAVAARAVHALVTGGGLGYFAGVADRPGFPAAVARTLTELRLADVSEAALRALPGSGPDLAALASAFERELASAGLADRARVLAAALDATRTGGAPVGVPLLLLDLPPLTPREAALVQALARRAPRVLATQPAGDERAIATLGTVLGRSPELLPAAPGPAALTALKTHLFTDTRPGALDASVSLRSWPGEARECVEIARALQDGAARGVSFDRMAVFLHAPATYASHLAEALERASIPACFARGATRPHPAGRALLALLACAAERLSARRFAEYLSLAQVPDPLAPAGEAWVLPANDLVPDGLVAPPAAPTGEDVRLRDPEAAAVIAGTLQLPWKWEELLVEAAVIGGVERWERRLGGLEQELRRQRAEAEEDGVAARIDRKLANLEHLRTFALPIVGRLAALPGQARWGEWLAALRALATAALREPALVLATLAELEPMAPVGPLGLDEVQLVLAPRLRDLPVAPPARRHGAVFVAPTDAARGLAFDVVFVPGLAEKVFPRKIVEDPLLLDAARATLGDLVTQHDRVAGERLALRMAIGAARDRVVLSYPRIDVEQARPRVPSFYTLEAWRAVTGLLPGVDELAVHAATASGRLGWPAPEAPADAIDEAEYDLALLTPLLDSDPEQTIGAARFLLEANAHLGRALRARARRWHRSWTVADGLVNPIDLGRAALAAHQMTARSFSPTALQHFAACPYRFFLQAVHRLQPREEPVALETLDPLTRGAIFHEIQFEVLTRLRAEGRLPVRPATLDAARAALDEVVTTVTGTWKETLAPAIPRVWEDAVGALRADLREWLRLASEADDGWVPDRFELSFGLKDRGRAQEDPASVPDPVPVIGALRLRGSIDLVERRADGALRATDHKTGKVRAKDGVIVGGGEVLQPVLYALVAERLLRAPVEAGRLYYCTADGGYTERVVPLDEHSRRAAATVAEVVGRALADGFLPAAPAKDACRWCDYRRVCGPNEELRIRRKPVDRLADLQRLRGLP